ncbi:hypothetical protein CRUP_002333 [Coryphaenoides rupestris]|nr:hypothetical protein CRUP_002333 [Coryphaenoides rupestris]
MTTISPRTLRSPHPPGANLCGGVSLQEPPGSPAPYACLSLGLRSLGLRSLGLRSLDNLSYIEHIFEISRRPDLLTRVVEYRTTVLKISEDDEVDTKLTRIPSAKKYKDIIRQPSEDEIIKLAPPPKKA